jgi:hypothetical protein
MNERIKQFERLWLARPPLPRLTTFRDFERPPLVRQTNRHHLLSPMSLKMYWEGDKEVKDALLATLSPIECFTE